MGSPADQLAPSTEAWRWQRSAIVCSNIFLSIACVVFIGQVALSSRHQLQRGRGDDLVGSRLDVPDVRWGNAPTSVVLALSTTCAYCEASSGFYKRLVHSADQQHVPVFALFPQRVDEAQRYLNASQIRVSAVRQLSLDHVHVTGTPTLLLVDSRGVITDAWLGRLSPDEETAVTRTIAKRESKTWLWLR